MKVLSVFDGLKKQTTKIFLEITREEIADLELGKEVHLKHSLPHLDKDLLVNLGMLPKQN